MTRPLAQALVLDFGGVISKTLFETHDLTERALGLAPCTLKWLGPFAPDSDPLWTSMQRGEISERDYWLTRGADPETVIRPEAARAINLAADAGLRLAILSNELDLFYGADFRTRLSILERFDAIVDATHTGILKPDPRAYQTVLDELALEADNCVFVDDQRRNIAGAAACNMRTVLFDVRNPAASYSEALRHFGLQFE